MDHPIGEERSYVTIADIIDKQVELRGVIIDLEARINEFENEIELCKRRIELYEVQRQKLKAQKEAKLEVMEFYKSLIVNNPTLLTQRKEFKEVESLVIEASEFKKRKRKEYKPPVDKWW